MERRTGHQQEMERISKNRKVCREPPNYAESRTGALKGASQVRRGAVGNVLFSSNALAAYSTANYAPKIPEKADVWAGSLCSASLARPTQGLIQAPHKVRMSPIFCNN
jgi:hypothetical protein